MKKFLAAIITVSMIFAMAVSVLAVDPAYTYEAQKLVNPVTFDGKVTDEEWADAVKLVINADNTVFKEYGRFQTDPRVAAPDKLSVTYYIKWDENNLYICEQRLDKDGLHNPTVDPSGPWMGDGTAFFFADVKDLTRADIRWIPYADTKDKKCAVYSQALDGEVTDKWQCYGGKDGDVYTIEIAMPWSAMGAQLKQEIKEGAQFRFCPIITSRDSDDMYGDWTTEVQMNFYDGFFKFGLENSEDPEYYAGIKLVGANYQAPVVEETPAQSVDEAPANNAADENVPEATPVNDVSVPVPAAPQTGDNAVVLVILIILAAAASGAVAFNRKRNSI